MIQEALNNSLASFIKSFCKTHNKITQHGKHNGPNGLRFVYTNDLTVLTNDLLVQFAHDADIITMKTLEVYFTINNLKVNSQKTATQMRISEESRQDLIVL
ncbi:hypothetical protein HHI36_021564 [Cryptolaemus montrouzieri]|uniref:Reverse transcriptase n=1 Tax=Cryptolaemus montrouzieri TaxID=559131 RepID=A0ABD2MXA8_9CUCU